MLLLLAGGLRVKRGDKSDERCWMVISESAALDLHDSRTQVMKLKKNERVENDGCYHSCSGEVTFRICSKQQNGPKPK